MRCPFSSCCAPKNPEPRIYTHPAEGIMYRGEFLQMQNRLTEAVHCYEQGLQIMQSTMEASDEQTKEYFTKEIQKYSTIVQDLQRTIGQNRGPPRANFCEQIRIEENSTGHSYETLFAKYLDDRVTSVLIEDPYIRRFSQCQNLLRFCEVLIKYCKNLKTIKLLTSLENDSKAAEEQIEFLNLLKHNLLNNYNIILKIEYSDTLHDRQIILGNGYTIKIGRGLGIYKPPENKFSIGIHDMNFRKCLRTNIDITFKNDTSSAGCSSR